MALAAKAAAAPAAATMTPPMAGPTLRVMLKHSELSATAAGTLARGTMSPTEACHDGLFSAVPLSIRKVKASSVHGVIQPCQVNKVSSAETTSIKVCATSI